MIIFHKITMNLWEGETLKNLKYKFKNLIKNKFFLLKLHKITNKNRFKN